MSYFNQTALGVSSLLADSLFAGAGIEGTDDRRAVTDGHADAAFATLTLLDSATFGYESIAGYQTALNSPEVQEVLRLQKKEVLTKAVEELKLRRQAVKAARHKIEEEVRRLSVGNEKQAPGPVDEGLAEHRLAMETACQLAEAELCRFAEKDASTRLQESISRAMVEQQERVVETGRSAGPEELLLVEAQVSRTNTKDLAPIALTLEQRVRGELKGLAAAQKKSIDSARARLLTANLARAAAAAYSFREATRPSLA